jgi:GNAT superfamily N-acetyltransferase
VATVPDPQTVICHSSPRLLHTNVRSLTADQERRRAVSIIRQLWCEQTRDEVLTWTSDDADTLLGGYVVGELVGVAGSRPATVRHHTDHAWPSDLVVDERQRDRGYGTALLVSVETWANERDCMHVALASPLEKAATRRFYEHRQYEPWGYREGALNSCDRRNIAGLDGRQPAQRYALMLGISSRSTTPESTEMLA